jgi:hypothetical protein
MKPIDYDLLTVDQFKVAIAELKREAESIPLPEGEEFFDALEDFAGPPSEGFKYTEEQNRQYAAWLARQQAKRQPKPLTEEEKRAAAKAKVIAFYTEENILNERSLWEDV